MPKESKPAIDYKELNTRLNEILHTMQSSDVTVDEAVALHTEGQEIIRKLQTYLEETESQITQLTS